MSTEENNKSFIKNLLERRVPQIIGIYLAISWGILEFTDWLVSRYKLSPHLTDLTIIILISLAPSILLVAYFHGKPGKDRWNLVEKVGIPANIILTIFLVVVVFSGKDLGSVEQTITIKNEKGEEIQRTVPKGYFKKNLVLFYFDPKSSDPKSQWLSYGITYMLQFDLVQDLYINTTSPAARGGMDLDYYFYNKFKEVGFDDGINVPLRLKQKITRELYKPYFLSGEFSVAENLYTITTRLYKAEKGKLMAENQFTGEHIFSLIDDISNQLKINLDLPKSHLEEGKDLPLEEIFTKSLEAARLVTLSQNAQIFQKDWNQAVKYLEEAIDIDPAFAYAYNELGLSYYLNNQIQKRNDIFAPQSPLMKHIYKLPERIQYAVRIQYYQTKQDMEKLLAIIDMMIQLNPDDLQAYEMRANFHILNNEREPAINLYCKMMEIDPSRTDLLIGIGNLSRALEDYPRAEEYYQKFMKLFPQDPQAYILLGNLADQQARFKLATEYFEKVLLIDPANVSTRLKLGRTHIKLGKYREALNYYHEALESASTPQLKADIYHSIADWYRKKGQLQKVLENIQKRIEQINQFAVPLLKIFSPSDNIPDYLAAGQREEALNIIKELETKLTSPLNQWSVVGRIMVFLADENYDQIYPLLPKLESLIKILGIKQLQLVLLSAKAELYEKTGQYQKAIEFYQQAMEMFPAVKEFHRSMGYCYRKLEKMKEAKQILDDALKHEPFNPMNNLEMANYYFDLDKIPEGLKYLKIALDIWQDADPIFKPANEARDLLKKYSEN